MHVSPTGNWTTLLHLKLKRSQEVPSDTEARSKIKRWVERTTRFAPTATDSFAFPPSRMIVYESNWHKRAAFDQERCERSMLLKWQLLNKASEADSFPKNSFHYPVLSPGGEAITTICLGLSRLNLQAQTDSLHVE